MAEWWQQLAGEIQRQAAPLAEGLQGFTNTIPQRAAMTGLNAARSIPGGGLFALGAGLLGGKADYARYDKNKPAQRFGGADAMAGRQMPNLAEPENMGMSDDELLAWILGGGGGGGGVNLSGYNELLNDIATRESGLNTRRGEQEAFLSELFDAAESRAARDRDALAASVQSALTSDAARRATEMGLVRGADTARLNTANAAREALGVEGGADLSSEIAQNQVGSIGASGSVADRDARIRQSLGEQQLNREIAGLVPMEAMSRQDLTRGYEDRLSALASERAAVRAQIAQARAAGGGGGPSVSERLAALNFVQGMGGEAPEAPGVLGFLNQSRASGDPTLFNNLAAIGDRILSTAVTSTIDPTKPAGAAEIISQLRAGDPAIDSLIRSNPGSLAWLTQYIQTAGSAG